ncbi:MAG: cysteine hydrolase [Desulfobacteraceae bacterium]|jgi:ureidoacrylate peracid hydrolase|nr:cysteine hydrolase [Desulfobacteraceae bacterium]
MELDSFSGKKKDLTFTINKESTAILVVDMLNDFLKPGGKMVLDTGKVIIEPSSRLIERARNNRIPIVYVNDSHRPGLRQDREFKKRAEHCIEGTWGAEVIRELKPQEGDFVVKKRRFSGFYETDLDLTLKDLEIDTVVIIGVVTNICVRSTIHDAFFRGYKVIIPRDCVMATGEREQESSLYDIETHFGEVTTLERVMELM